MFGDNLLLQLNIVVTISKALKVSPFLFQALDAVLYLSGKFIFTIHFSGTLFFVANEFVCSSQ